MTTTTLTPQKKSAFALMSSKSMEFASTLRDALKGLDPSNTVVGIQAPTGVGKTTMMVEFFREKPRTLMIMPTQLACQQWHAQKRPTDRMTIMNASRAVDYFIRHQGLHHFRTVILDEAHVDSREYYTIRKILSRATNKGKRRPPLHQYFFVSATLPIAFLRQSFPDMHVLSYDAFRPYKIDIFYEPAASSYYEGRVDRRQVLDLAAKRLTLLGSSARRVLIFTPTHEECDDLARRVDAMRKKMELLPVSDMGSCPVLVLHGGLDPEEKDEVKQKLRTASSCILIATNIAESSITIPDIDAVIDTGLECRLEGSNYTVVTRASKMSLIQRAGRAGRTKDGVVYRLMSEDVFNKLSEFSTEEHDLDPIVLRCLIHKTNPVWMLGASVRYNLTFLGSVGIHTRTPRDKLVFLEACGLRTIAGSLLWNLVYTTTTRSAQEVMWIALLILVIEQYDKKSLNWVYYPRDKTGRAARLDPAIQRLNRFNQKLCYEGDMLVTIARMLLSILAYGKAWRDAASSISLNQKNVREFMSDWKRVFRHIRHLFPTSEPELGAVDMLLETLRIEKIEKPLLSALPIHLQKKDNPSHQGATRTLIVDHKAVDLDPEVVRRGREFLLHQPFLYGPKFTHRFYKAPAYYDWPDNRIHGEADDDDDTYYTESRYFNSAYDDFPWHPHHWIDRSPGYDPSFSFRPPKAIHPIRLREHSYGNLMLWTNMPEDLDSRHHQLLQHDLPRWKKHQDEKDDVRRLKKAVVEEMDNSVALMPPSDNMDIDSEYRFSGGYLWQQAEEDFMRRLQERS